jgi:hypothetical protein
MELVMTRTRIDDGGEDDDGSGSDQIWARARTTMVDLNMGAAHGRERCESGHRWRWRERCACVEAVVLEAMRSGDGVVALGRRTR